MKFQDGLTAIINGHKLTAEQTRSLMRQIMEGELTEVQVGALLVALATRGETTEELAAAASVMREFSTPITVANKKHLIDTCGTGGDGANLFNISTTVAFVVAGAGGRVAKHGNRAVSGSSGSADVLKAAGVNLELTPEQTARCIDEIGVGFLFAPGYHPAMRYVAGVRQSLKVRTLFNLLGPMTNPAGVQRQLVGVFSQRWLIPVVEALGGRLGGEHIMAVHAEDGLDELSLAAPTHVAEWRNGRLTEYKVNPSDLGFSGDMSSLKVSDAQDSLRLLREVLAGRPGPARDIVVLNAGAALYVADLCGGIENGIEMAARSIDDGAAAAALQRLIDLSHASDK